MNISSLVRISVLFVLAMISVSAHAYVGPGLGLGVIGVILGGIVAVLLAIAGVVWYPMKRLLKKKKGAGSVDTKGEQNTAQEESDSETDLKDEA